jgi:radical SAM-linked protein
MNMAAALPFGFSSCEVMDMKLEHDIPLDDLPTRLNRMLPSGLQVVDVEPVEERAPALQTQVVSAEYEVTLTESIDRSDLERKIDSVIESKALPRERRGKMYDPSMIDELAHPNLLLGKGQETKIFMMVAGKTAARKVLDVLGIPLKKLVSKELI